jgi:hypothetical protein
MTGYAIDIQFPNQLVITTILFISHHENLRASGVQSISER